MEELIRTGLPNGGGIANPLWLWDQSTITSTGTETSFTVRKGVTQAQSGFNSIGVEQNTLLP